MSRKYPTSSQQIRLFTNGLEIVKARDVKSALKKVAEEYDFINEENVPGCEAEEYGKDFIAVPSVVSYTNFKKHMYAVKKDFAAKESWFVGEPVLILMEENNMVYFLRLTCNANPDVCWFEVAGCSKKEFIHEDCCTSTTVKYSNDPKTFAYNVRTSFNETVEYCREEYNYTPEEPDATESEAVYMFDGEYFCKAKSAKQAGNIYASMLRRAGNKDAMNWYLSGDTYVDKLDEDILNIFVNSAVSDLANKFDAPYTVYANSFKRTVDLSLYATEDFYMERGIREDIKAVVHFDDARTPGMYEMYIELEGLSKSHKQDLLFNTLGDYDRDTFLDNVEAVICDFLYW